MTRFALALLILLSTAALAQVAKPPAVAPQRPTPEELAFSRLPADLQQMLAGLTPAQAVQAVEQTKQHLIALGVPDPSPEQFRYTLRSLLNNTYYSSGSNFSSVGSASAGTTTFPPLSPLVAPPPPPLPQR